jgi:hypothetical protein
MAHSEVVAHPCGHQNGPVQTIRSRRRETGYSNPDFGGATFMQSDCDTQFIEAVYGL